MGVHGSSGLDGGVSASEEEAEEDDESSAVVSIGEVIGASMAVLSTWRRGDGRYTAGRIDDGVAVQAISHDNFVGVRIVVVGADVGGLDNRGVDVGGRGIVVLVVQICCRLPIEKGVQIDGIGGLCGRGVDVFVLVKVCRALATKNGVEIDVHCERLNDGMNDAMVCAMIDAMLDGMLTGVLEDSNVCKMFVREVKVGMCECTCKSV
ncbi:MAG: hypothetical protein Q9198_006930 [Flavoplaca austrocitrina]